MNIKIVNDGQNKLLNRREVVFEISHSGEPTPSRKEVKTKLAAKLTADDKMIVVQPLDSDFGSSVLKGVANIYKKEEDMKVESAPILKRNTEEPEKKEEAPAEAPEEAPKEEKKEEPKKEEKKEAPKKEVKEAPKKEEKKEAPKEAPKKEEKKEESK